MKQVNVLKSDIGKLVATPSGIWLCRGDDAISVSWEEIESAKQAVSGIFGAGNDDNEPNQSCGSKNG